MITFIPYQHFEIKTKLSQDATREKLADIVEPRQLGWRFSNDHKLFEGELDINTFKISRVIRYRNSFLPVLVGNIQDDLDSSSLQITARPNWFVIILWPVLLIAFFFSTIISAEVTTVGLILLFILFFYGVPTLFFNFELNKAKKLLDEQFKTDSYSLP
jgi:Flp pilus assembly protein TadB